MDTRETTQLEEFREHVYQSFARYADTSMDLLDALCSQTRARSVAELSLEPCSRREYSSQYKAIDRFFEASHPEQAADERREKGQALLRLVAGHLPSPQRQGYWLFGTDTTSVARQFAHTLADRGFVYQVNALKGNKPVTIGHRYSLAAHLPEKVEQGAPTWIVPLAMRRVTTKEKEVAVGIEQLEMLMDDESLPWYGELCVHVGDTQYGTLEYLAAACTYLNLVAIARLRSNRTLYRRPARTAEERPAGHPTWYGERFSLSDPDTWYEPDEVAEWPYTSRRGRTYTVQIKAWHNMLMRGKRGCPMHQYPFTLVQIVWRDADGEPAFKHPIWLLVIGQRRHELSLSQAQQAYTQRYDLEHFFRFGKQRLLLTDYQTPNVQREENWWQLVSLAYAQLWLARHLVQQLPRPWERYLPQPEAVVATPTMTQRGFGRIIRQLGTPAASPKPRGNSPGRAKGTRLKPRDQLPVVRKAG